MNLTRNNELDAAIERLSRGGMVAFPTETVYGLGTDAFDQLAVSRVFALKGRPDRNPLIVHVANVAMARLAVATWPREAELLAERFWPGPLTIVLPKAPAIPENVSGGGPNVGVRCPDHPVTLELLRTFGRPLVGPSANPSGRISPTAASHVKAYFAPQQVLVLDGGACRAGIESTVVSIVDPLRPVILRPGIISAQAISEALGVPVEIDQDHHEHGPLPGPGMSPSHYAPTTPSRMVSASEAINAASAASPQRAILSITTLREAARGHVVIQMASDAPTYAANLYAALMRADAAGVSEILIETPPMKDGNPLWVAVMDRLTRATSTR
jgi:L-threonylcarbamoyladenylate synthase